jgi:hypothetical protein
MGENHGTQLRESCSHTVRVFPTGGPTLTRNSRISFLEVMSVQEALVLADAKAHIVAIEPINIPLSNFAMFKKAALD